MAMAQAQTLPRLGGSDDGQCYPRSSTPQSKQQPLLEHLQVQEGEVTSEMQVEQNLNWFENSVGASLGGQVLRVENTHHQQRDQS